MTSQDLLGDERSLSWKGSNSRRNIRNSFMSRSWVGSPRRRKQNPLTKFVRIMKKIPRYSFRVLNDFFLRQWHHAEMENKIRHKYLLKCTKVDTFSPPKKCPRHNFLSLFDSRHCLSELFLLLWSVFDIEMMIVQTRRRILWARDSNKSNFYFFFSCFRDFKTT